MNPHTMADEEIVHPASPDGDRPAPQDEPYSHVTGKLWLSHDLTTSPAPLRVSADGALDLVIAYPYQQLPCAYIKVTLATGAKPGDLTADPGTVKASVISADKRWVRSNPAAGVYLFKPNAGTWLPIGEQGLQIQFNDIKVNPLVGTTEITIEESVGKPVTGGREIQFVQHTATYLLGKFPADYKLSNFTPQRPVVHSGEAVTLTWVAGEGPTYELAYGLADTTDVTKARAFTTPPLFATTVFRLTARHSQNGASAVHHLDTAVQVMGGDVGSRDLDVSGSVSMMRRPQQVQVPTETGTHVFVAQTDGFLRGDLSAHKDAALRTMEIDFVDQRKATKSTERYTMEKSASGVRANERMVPIPANTLVRIVNKQPSPDRSQVEGEAPSSPLDWVALGSGTLQRVQPRPFVQAIPDPSDPDVTWFLYDDDVKRRAWPYSRTHRTFDRSRVSVTAVEGTPGTGTWGNAQLRPDHFGKGPGVFRDPARANTVWIPGYAFVRYDVKERKEIERVESANWGKNTDSLVQAWVTLDDPDRPGYVWAVRKEGVEVYDVKSRERKGWGSFEEYFPGIAPEFAEGIQAVLPLSALDRAYGHHVVVFMTGASCIRYDLRLKRPLSTVRSLYREIPALIDLA
ncbi:MULTISPECIES: hypothetical protein [unclassified Streptomyces]|uniref:hypothetical protein n=1 Tax=unclassified Streptomyces TaxID=2593676 RepID=UPI002254958D|nr:MULTISPECIES: hypothetical protein [unclassified Streptomyces]MCX4529428.1 hypothetical protein [Streptomyces sp. NBC_01551]MCX4540032.1 hypothetical protein [Streptomyces sp. NBC_01565]